ncbi:helix-turn-helix domain-containing protein [Flavonifractor plautii]|jgi:transcriptional regulator with XRE-family HTH domain|uniref:helix-turn-helix domain-containing protein n=1 Tax=Flavonifractor plautii TaxID=292800 RepID=UPI0009BD6703|nr:helix-turn-helix transcriptional regulator [Flavonifractor plautii]
MNIAQNLKKLMDNRGLSNSRLAREIHVHTSTISNWLEGKEVKAENLTALCEYFGCSLDYLAGTTTEKAPTQEGERDFAQNHHEEDMLLLARHMAPIPEEDRNALKEQFKNSIDLYLKAKGLSGSD